MTVWVDVARVAIGVNLLLLLSLVYVWGRNYAQIRSPLALGLLLFGGFLFLENGMAFYFYFFEPTLRVWVTEIPALAQLAMTLLRVCETVALVFLTWTTWR
ncbi:hypothetical protein ACFO0N_07235 [Halobium salinum]|uniref:Lycopene cyclase domain-containing protein n=1 Tax=Halobium salinum TaxID=1364940 RepID=A0ABD5PA23_9EURY|nr:hypothetical protein [Halobium salinum]